jgi:hypothetical protein
MTELEAGRGRIEEIEAELLVVDETIVSIDNQLDAADGKRVDRDWLIRARAARRFHGLERARLQTELARVKRQIRDAENAGFDGRFKTVAKRRLSPELYESILAECVAA